MKSFLLMLVAFIVGVLLTLYVSMKAAGRRDALVVAYIDAQQSLKAKMLEEQGDLLHAFASYYVEMDINQNSKQYFSEQTRWTYGFPIYALVLEPFQASNEIGDKNKNNLSDLAQKNVLRLEQKLTK